ncbi:GAP family protein [Sanguibacter sp. 25GB23B1]|uniref:GAP family protein n=1 Tax=unclassified Sanguibacter TaxID=2645534 RepID=UPI0032AFA741
MLDVLGEAFPLAMGIALSPLPTIAIVLVLLAPPGRRGGTAFLAARLVAVGAVVGLFAVVSDVAERSGDAAPAVAVTQVIVGAALLLVALKTWRGRPRGGVEPDLPGWMSSIEGRTPGQSAQLAAVLTLANPKELLLAIGTGVAIGSGGLPIGQTVVVAAVLTAVACINVIAPVVAFLLAGERVRAPLSSARAALVRHNATIMSIVLVAIAALLVSGGIADL